MPHNILVTGVPGVGKTTLIKRLCDSLPHNHATGFYTSEIRKGRIRKGFELIGLDDSSAILSHVDIKSTFRVGKYGVDVAGFDDFLDSISFFRAGTDLIVIDEIGKMECFSSRFRNILQKVLDSEIPVVASIALKGGGIIAETKRRKDVKLFRITSINRDSILEEILRLN
jgi:nucleoside-triphosphatase